MKYFPVDCNTFAISVQGHRDIIATAHFNDCYCLLGLRFYRTVTQSDISEIIPCLLSMASDVQGDFYADNVEHIARLIRLNNKVLIPFTKDQRVLFS